MRKVLLGVVTAVIILSLGSASAFAAGPEGGRYFVDTDGNGICDNAGNRCAYVDADGDGVCDNYGSGWGRGYGRSGNFVDADGDGVCDNYGSGWGRGYGRGGNFVDADGDGVCDNYGSGWGRGYGRDSNFVDADGDGTATYKTPRDKKKSSVAIPATVKIEGKPCKVTAIEKNAFKGNKKLKTVKIGSNVEKIGANAFNKCVNLKKVTIPSKVKTIQKGAFSNCKNLESITIQTKELTKKTIGANAFKGINSKATVKVPKGKAKAYKKLLRSKGLSKNAKVI